MNRFDELRDKILPVLGPYVTRISLFGSMVRDETTLESDIDILVKLKSAGERPPLGLRWFDLEEELEHILGRPVDLVSESALSPYIRPYVEREKVVLYEES